MRLASAIVFFAVLHAGDPPCSHGTKGESRRVDVEALVKRYDELARAASKTTGRLTPKLADAPYESGLPACRRGTRVVKKRLPLSGRTFTFGPAPADFVTSARRLSDAYGHGLATPEICAIFDVRCARTTVKVRKDDLELLEEP